jgi:hypothetical protein
VRGLLRFCLDRAAAIGGFEADTGFINDPKVLQGDSHSMDDLYLKD